MNEYQKAVDVLDEMSDELLLQCAKETQNPVIPEDSVLSKVIIAVFGQRNIVHLQIMTIIPALLTVMSDRLYLLTNETEL